MKFGDLILNNHASVGNPHRVSMFIRYSGGYIQCMARDGARVQYSAGDQHKEGFLQVVGSIDFRFWDTSIKYHGSYINAPAPTLPVPSTPNQETP